MDWSSSCENACDAYSPSCEKGGIKMTERDIRPLLDATPFEPFTITMTGKWSHDIVRPELVSFTPHGSMNLHNPDGSVHCVLSMDHIVSIIYPAAVPHIR